MMLEPWHYPRGLPRLVLVLLLAFVLVFLGRSKLGSRSDGVGATEQESFCGEKLFFVVRKMV